MSPNCSIALCLSDPHWVQKHSQHCLLRSMSSYSCKIQEPLTNRGGQVLFGFRITHSERLLVREQNEDFGLFLTKYGLERILFRLSQSRHRDVFILKGALLFELWTEQNYRPTRDADFLGTGESSLEGFTQILEIFLPRKWRTTVCALMRRV